MTRAQVPLVPVNLATTCIVSFLYGIFFLLCATSLFLLVTRQRYRNPNQSWRSIFLKPMVSSTILIFCTITAHWILIFVRVFDAFVIYHEGRTPLEFYDNLNQPTEIVKTAFIQLSLIIGDAVIIYRLWIVWSYSRWVIIPPICTLLGLIGCGIGLEYQLINYQPGQTVFLAISSRWITGDCVFTLCTNLYSTIFIFWRIWRINSATRKFGSKTLSSALAIIIESAALYTCWSIFFFIAYEAKSNLQYLAVDTWAIVSGISFMLINVRVGMGWAQKAHVEVPSLPPISTLHFGETNPQAWVPVVGSTALHPIAVNISTMIETKSGMD